MSLTIFLALCILGSDFMIYALFQWIYGEKRRAFARQVAARNRARKDPSNSPFLIVAKAAALHTPRPRRVDRSRKRTANNRPFEVHHGPLASRTA
jgi:hypothetical protein